MKKILFVGITNFFVRGGGSLATLAYYNAFCHEFGRQNVNLALPAEFCYGPYAFAIAVPPRKRWLTYLKLFQGRFHRYYDFFRKYLKKHHDEYDVAVINGGFYAGDMVKMFQQYGIKVVVIHHNYEPEYHMDNRTLPTMGGLTPFFVRRNERNAYLSADLNAYLTQADIKLHQQHYGNCNNTFCLGVSEPEKVECFPNERKKVSSISNKNIVITGSMNSVQTICGIMDFKKHYFHIVQELLPDWKIIIAGRDPDPRIQKFASDYSDIIQLIPNPENIDDIISRGSIFLCPTNVGGGLKLRLMDGLRHGLPVLTHSISARGYDAFFGRPFFQIYNSEQSFVIGVEKLKDYIKGKSEDTKISELYRSNFGFEAGCARVKHMMKLLNFN